MTVLCFITNGKPNKGKLPYDEIKKFKKNVALKDQLAFYAVGYGLNFDKHLLT